MSRPSEWDEDAVEAPCITDTELAEIRDYAARKNDDLLLKLLKDRSFWVRQCAHYDARAMVEAKAKGWKVPPSWAMEIEESFTQQLEEERACQPAGFLAKHD